MISRKQVLHNSKALGLVQNCHSLPQHKKSCKSTRQISPFYCNKKPVFWHDIIKFWFLLLSHSAFCIMECALNVDTQLVTLITSQQRQIQREAERNVEEGPYQ